MLDNKVIIHNNARLDCGEINKALDFLIEKVKDKFSMIKETLRENEIRIDDNYKLNLRKVIDDVNDKERLSIALDMIVMIVKMLIVMIRVVL